MLVAVDDAEAARLVADPRCLNMLKKPLFLLVLRPLLSRVSSSTGALGSTPNRLMALIEPLRAGFAGFELQWTKDPSMFQQPCTGLNCKQTSHT